MATSKNDVVNAARTWKNTMDEEFNGREDLPEPERALYDVVSDFEKERFEQESK